MDPQAVRRIVSQVIRRVAEKMGVDGRKGRLIAVFTGASADFAQSVDQIRGLILDGYRVETVLSEAAEAIYGATLREMIEGFPQIAPVSETRWVTAADDALGVVVPMLSLNTLSRIALLMADNKPTNIILRALFTGRPVLLVPNGALVRAPHWQAKAGGSQAPALAAAVEERLSAVGRYGAQIVDVNAIRRTVAAWSRNAAGPAAGPVPAATSGNGAGPIRAASTVVSAAQVRLAHSAGADLVITAQARVTPLARDLALRYGVALVREAHWKEMHER